MGKRTKSGRKEASPNPVLQTPKPGSKRRQHFSPTGITPEEKVKKPGSTGPSGPGATPSSSLSAGGSGSPPGRGLTEVGPELVSAASSEGRRPEDNPANPSVASGSGGLGDGHHDLLRGTSPSGPGASKEDTAPPAAAALDGSGRPTSAGTSSGPAKDKGAKIKLGHLAELLGIPEAEAARDLFCREVASGPGSLSMEDGQKDGSPSATSEATVEAADGPFHQLGKALASPALATEVMDTTDDSQSSFVTTKTSATPSTSGAGNDSNVQSPNPLMA